MYCSGSLAVAVSVAFARFALALVFQDDGGCYQPPHRRYCQMAIEGLLGFRLSFLIRMAPLKYSSHALCQSVYFRPLFLA